MKVNKKLKLMLILVLVIGVLSGCGKQAKVPEGVNQEFYDDMIECSEGLIKTIKNAKITSLLESDILNNEYYSKIQEYMNNTDGLTLIEQNILTSIENLYFHVAMQYDGAELSDEIKEYAQTFSKLMEMEVDVNNLLLK
mgnify:FL=1